MLDFVGYLFDDPQLMYRTLSGIHDIVKAPVAANVVIDTPNLAEDSSSILEDPNKKGDY